ncbi:putative O-acetyltransferase CAS1 [Daldinia childiae]|uniref:putative O-acetyltransferase CAS1 n=1 Tax=Daldinia childiae TaxID=326645 RepID=UPI00144677BD|nr:putative O-acetyltransferase CAS1 [Daldinia childiae]KAF3064026.1 putative O-acetyltransferase CAS1 [Daldinia childiae]
MPDTSSKLANYALLFIAFLTFTTQNIHATYGKNDPHRCLTLLNNGTWSPLAPDGSRRWEPKDCRMVEHTADFLHGCLNDRKVVFIGDSTIRQLFWAATKQVAHRKSETRIKRLLQSNGKHHDISFRADNVQLEFIWDPWLNSTVLHDVLKSFHALSTSLDVEAIVGMDELSPMLVILGAPGLWAARYGGDDYLNLFKRAVTGVVPYLSPSLDNNISLAMETTRGPDDIPNRIFLTPVGIPDYSNLAPNRSKSITPERIETMNNYLSQVFPNNLSYIPWVYNRIPTLSKRDFDIDGLHASDSMAALKLNIAFNALCNPAASARSRSFKGTCCAVTPPNYAALIVFVLFGTSAGFVAGARRHLETAGSSGVVQFTEILKNVLATLLWCWYADGTYYLIRAERHYEQNAFVAACLIWLVVSVLSSRKAPQQTDGLSSSKRDARYYRGPGYLSRNQSNEIKGLMQGIILLYHYHYASQALWVYKIIRLFISGYLYISGYAHTLYLLETNDFSLNRVMEILCRLNFLSVFLSYVMRTTYTSYYFAPVVTFWYLVLYAMLRFFKSYNRDLRWLLLKIAITIRLTNIFILSPGILETVTGFIHDVFYISIDVEEMRFRLRLDRYITFIGIIVAALTHRASIRRERNFLQFGWVGAIFTLRFTLWLAIVCVGSTITFFYVTQTYLQEKQAYNQIHPFISWIPILSFIVLRNSHRMLRDRCLYLPNLLGRISLETYILQYHIWLGGDATAKLFIGYWEGR